MQWLWRKVNEVLVLRDLIKIRPFFQGMLHYPPFFVQDANFHLDRYNAMKEDIAQAVQDRADALASELFKEGIAKLTKTLQVSVSDESKSNIRNSILQGLLGQLT